MYSSVSLLSSLFHQQASVKKANNRNTDWSENIELRLVAKRDRAGFLLRRDHTVARQE
ncbi:hypothetical protein RvY_10153 [Ramazzottius varieornatus]|uniref:Uncharacterized protein n=1 Tax=Ramazzottius varieornatus TaxID=947166 RepID=A0A1D1VBV0_RAMVA|nr:hypothetical protein RvY_10153 [Ramazzottius varieornatus]